MPRKGLENTEYMRQWRKKNSEKAREYMRQWYLKKEKKKDPNYKPQITYHDYETHHQLAIYSGVRAEREWRECHQRGFMPDGIYRDPSRSFGRHNPKFIRRRCNYEIPKINT